jgi:hypothetical protein
VCDPACGSGAFLNQALSYFIEEHKFADDIIAELTNTPLRLFDTDLQILENNIFGVDINDESVEIAKLSMWLRTAQPGRKLSDLSNNIKCGNSLIDDPAVAGDKAFNWEKEFPTVFEKGGFDVVIGNPPYVSKIFSNHEKTFFNEKFSTAQYQLDLYVSFMEIGTRLISKKGALSYIVPNSWLKNLQFDKCREYLLNNLSFITIIPNLGSVFLDASVDTMIFIARVKNVIHSNIEIGKFENSEFKPKHTIEQNRFSKNKKSIFDVEISGKLESIFSKMEKATLPLHQIADITRGINPYDAYRGQDPEIIKNQLYHSTYKKDDTFVPEIRGRHLNRYEVLWDGQSYVSYGSWLAAPREPRFFSGHRLICRQILGSHLNCSYVQENLLSIKVYS